MTPRYLILVLLLIVTSGCFGITKGSVKESDVDSALTKTELSSNVPLGGPAEPQKDFEQELKESQNP